MAVCQSTKKQKKKMFVKKPLQLFGLIHKSVKGKKKNGTSRRKEKKVLEEVI